jgi:16S rRNA (cytosine1407-C5)-methyltransferase
MIMKRQHALFLRYNNRHFPTCEFIVSLSQNLPQDFITLATESLPASLALNDFFTYSQKPLRRSIRVNTLKMSVAQFRERMEARGWQLTAVPWCKEGFWLERDDETTPLGNTLEHLSGLFYIQEASSMMPVTALFEQIMAPDPLLLDAAAAPGSKTTQIAAKLGHRGGIVANEYSASRVKVLYSNLQRCGIANVALTNYNADIFGPWLPETFDGVLLDAPCSGEGTLRKDPDAMNNWSLEHVHSVADLQLDLLDSALHALKPGGVVVYSTCTLNRIENQGVLATILERYGDALEVASLKGLFDGADAALTPEGYLHIWPQVFDCEGFFVSALRKTQALPAPDPVDKRIKPLPFKSASRQQSDTLKTYLDHQFGIKLETQARLMVRDNEYWLFPEQILPLTAQMRFQRIGLKLAEQFKANFRLTHEAAIRFGVTATKNCAELTLEQARDYYHGRDIAIAATKGQKGEVLLSCDGSLLGLGKWVNNKIKNSLPRELVRDNNLF